MQKTSMLDNNQKLFLKKLAILMRNCGYVMLTMSIINLIIVVAMGFRYLPELELDNWLEIISTSITDFDFIILIDYCLVPVFWIFLSLQLINSSRELNNIFMQESEDIDNLFKSLFHLKKFFHLFYVLAIVYISLLWIKMIAT